MEISFLEGNNGTKTFYHSGLSACDKGGDQGACIRASITGLLAALTFLCCLNKLWLLRKSQDPSQSSFMVIFFFGAIQTTLLSIKWLYYGTIVIHFIAIYTQVLQALLLCFWYCKLALKVHDQRNLITRVMNPFLVAMVIYFTSVLAWAITSKKDNGIECREPAWVLFSASEVVLVALFILAGVYLTRAMNKFPTAKGAITTWKKVTLWSLITAFTLMALMDFGIDMAFYISTGVCDDVFGPVGYSIYTYFNRFAHVLPLWVMLSRLEAKSQHKTDMLSDDGYPDIPQVSVFKTQRSVQSLESWDDVQINPYGQEDAPLLTP